MLGMPAQACGDCGDAETVAVGGGGGEEGGRAD